MSSAIGVCRKLKKLLRRRKSELDSKQEEELNKTLQRHERDHILGPFVGLSPEYMEMSESEQKAFANKYINIHNMHMAAVLCEVIKSFFLLEIPPKNYLLKYIQTLTGIWISLQCYWGWRCYFFSNTFSSLPDVC